MTLGQVALDVWAGFVVVSLAAIALFCVTVFAVSVLTVANARRRARELSRRLNALAQWCSVSELAEMDEALDRVWAGDRGVMPGPGVR